MACEMATIQLKITTKNEILTLDTIHTKANLCKRISYINLMFKTAIQYTRLNPFVCGLG